MEKNKAGETQQPDTQVNNNTAPAPQNQATAAKKSNKKLFIIIGVVVFFLFILPGILFAIFVGYIAHRGGEKIVEDIAKSQGVDVDLNTKDGNISIKDKNGKEYSAQSGTSLPDDFPKNEITLYGTTYASTNRLKIGTNTSWSVTIETTDSPSAVTAKVKEQLTAKGWVVENESSSEGYTMLTAKKGTMNAVVTTSTTDGKTTVGYVINQESSTNEQ